MTLIYIAKCDVSGYKMKCKLGWTHYFREVVKNISLIERESVDKM